MYRLSTFFDRHFQDVTDPLLVQKVKEELHVPPTRSPFRALVLRVRPLTPNYCHVGKVDKGEKLVKLGRFESLYEEVFLQLNWELMVIKEQLHVCDTKLMLWSDIKALSSPDLPWGFVLYNHHVALSMFLVLI